MIGFATVATGIAIVGWCLVHVVWQAACVGALYAAARALLPRGNPRYVAAMLALLVIAACPIATAGHEWGLLARPVALGGVLVTPATAVPPAGAASVPLWRSMLALSLPWLVLAWAAAWACSVRACSGSGSGCGRCCARPATCRNGRRARADWAIDWGCGARFPCWPACVSRCRPWWDG